jgi:archaellum biogenesis ATPase FlaH
MTAKLLSVKKKNDRNFITVECLLAFDKDEDEEKVLDLMRKFSSMVRIEKAVSPKVWDKHTLFRLRHIFGTANFGLLPTKRAKSPKACVWFKRIV